MDTLTATDGYLSFEHLRFGGNSGPLRAFIGGLNYARRDPLALAETLGGSMVALDQPAYCGRGDFPAHVRDRSFGQANVRDLDTRIARSYAASLASLGCQTVIAHSRGILHALLALEEWTRLEKAMPSPPDLVAITPALKEPPPKARGTPRAIGKNDLEQYLDAVLCNFCGVLSDRDYAAMLQRHAEELRGAQSGAPDIQIVSHVTSVIKKMGPRGCPVPVEDVNAIVRKSTGRILIVLGHTDLDPWRDDGKLTSMIAGAESRTEFLELPSDHAPHLGCTQALAEGVIAWEKN